MATLASRIVFGETLASFAISSVVEKAVMLPPY
jgi:hypothetical protein